ncbi:MULTISPECIES: DUF7507 domain-containing protein [unclassified Leucobacter]|uniref:DUF7507 domain-containing protein n=1 Tax=unclassified Leucobacter TaxID=2621730 RepID=UPI003015964E
MRDRGLVKNVRRGRRAVRWAASVLSAVVLASTLQVTAGASSASAVVLPAPAAASAAGLEACTPAEIRATKRYWYFGSKAGLDFGADGNWQAPFTPISSNGTAGEGTTVVTDTTGALRFWSNGREVYDRTGAIMKNSAGGLGKNSAAQTVVAMPALGSPGRYFVVTTGYEAEMGVAGAPLYYSVVDMNRNNGLGEMIQKNVRLGWDGVAGEGLAATINATGDGYWVYSLGNGSRQLHRWEFKAAGPTSTTPQSQTLSETFTAFSSIFVDNTAGSTQVAITAAEQRRVIMATVNRATGAVTERTAFNTGLNAPLYGAAFTDTGRHLYVSSLEYTPGQHGELIRFDVKDRTESQIWASRKWIANSPVAAVAGYAVGSGGALKLGPNGVIFWSPGSLQGTLSGVWGPDLAAPSFGNGVALANGTSTIFGLPDMVTGCERKTPGLTATATVSKPGYSIGDDLEYRVVLRNTGNVPLSSVGAEGAPSSGAGAGLSCPRSTLALDESMTCTAALTTTQAHIDVAALDYQVQASGRGATSGTTTGTITAEASVRAVPQRVDQLAVSAAPASTSYANVGDAVSFDFTVTNTGNTTANGVGVAAEGFTGAGSLSGISCPQTVLAPSASMTCTAQTTATQADIDRGQVALGGTATATPAGLTEPISARAAAAVVPAVQMQQLTLAKAAAATSIDTAGTEVDYTFTVTNAGNTTLSAIAVDEGGFAGAGTAPEVSCPGTVLAPTASMTCTATYTSVQADVERGSILNTATASASTPAGATIQAGASSASVTAEQRPALKLRGAAAQTEYAAVGDTIDYQYTLTNTGNLGVSSLAVTSDEFTGAATPEVGCDTDVLAPTASTTCTASYVVTQDDIDRGDILSTVEAHGAAASGPVASGAEGVTVPAVQQPAVALLTGVSTSRFAAGQALKFTFDVENIGNVSLANLAVDAEFTGDGELGDIACDSTALRPGEELHCAAGYVATQADVDRGMLDTTATVLGISPRHVSVSSSPSQAVADSPAEPELTLTHTVSTPDVLVGDTVTYTAEVTNAGTVTVEGVALAVDEFTGLGAAPVFACADAAAVLPPGVSVQCTAAYTVIDGDAGQGAVDHAVRAAATTAVHGVPVTSEPAAATVKATAPPVPCATGGEPGCPAPDVRIATTGVAGSDETVLWAFFLLVAGAAALGIRRLMARRTRSAA